MGEADAPSNVPSGRRRMSAHKHPGGMKSMPSRKRCKTRYPGVYYVETYDRGTRKTERAYYIVYRVERRQVEKAVGGQRRDGMTAARASRLRSEHIARQWGAAPTQGRQMRILDALWDTYTRAHGHKACGKGDIYRYEKHIRKRLGRLTPEEITTPHLEELRADLEKTLKPQTVAHVLGQVKRILRYAVKINRIEGFNHFHFPMPVVDNGKTEMLTSQELQRFLNALDEERDQVGAAGVRLALFTGMRHSAIAALRWEDIDFEHGFIVLRGSEAKNGRTSRIPLSDPARLVLENLPRADSEFLFPGKKNGHRCSFRDVARRVKQQAALPEDFRCMHGLRHTFASLLASSGEVDLYTLQKLLTHRSQRMTERYSHLSDEALHRAGSVVALVVGGGKKEENTN